MCIMFSILVGLLIFTGMYVFRLESGLWQAYWPASQLLLPGVAGQFTCGHFQQIVRYAFCPSVRMWEHTSTFKIVILRVFSQRPRNAKDQHINLYGLLLVVDVAMSFCPMRATMPIYACCLLACFYAQLYAAFFFFEHSSQWRENKTQIRTQTGCWAKYINKAPATRL